VKPHSPAAEPARSPGLRTVPAAAGLGRLLEGPLDLARHWAGEDRLGLIVSGSHAAGDAVWVTHEGRPVSLSDLDVYAVVRDVAAKRTALARARAARTGLGARLLALGLAAPLEVGFHTLANLAALPARPGTLELRRSGRVVEGDPALREAVPAWTAGDVGHEEVWLLLENRAFELLWAATPGGHDPRRAELEALKRRHAVLKCALDLASVTALSAGEYPRSAGERVAWARARPDHAPADDRSSPEPPWDAALAWRNGQAEPLEPGAAAAERLRTVVAWVATWRRLAGVPADPPDPFTGIGRIARRARLRRRLREALLPDALVARLRVPGGRLRHALDGTPRHRLNAAAAALLMFEASCGTPRPVGREGEALGAELRRVLRRLGVASVGPESGAELVRAWDRGLLDGQRTEDWA